MTRCPHPEMVAVRMCPSCGWVDKSVYQRYREALYAEMFALLQDSGGAHSKAAEDPKKSRK